MGAVSTKNIVDTSITSSIDILNKTIQKCETKLSQYQSINIYQCENVTISDVDFSQVGDLDVQCAQNSSSTNDAKQLIETKMAQMATSINQALSLNPNSTTAQNIVSLSQQLSTAIQNEYSQTCIAQVNGTQSINVTCPSSGGTVNINQVNFEQFHAQTQNCVQESVSVTTISNEIKTIIDQTATAEVAPLISFGSLVVILLLVFVILFFGFGSKLVTIVIILVIISLIVLTIYFVLASIYKWWPFN